MNRYTFFLFLTALGSPALAQVGVNATGTPPHASAMLDVSSTSSGVLIPRMTSAQRNSISSPAQGLLIFNTDTGCLNMYRSGNWSESCFDCIPPPDAALAGPDQSGTGPFTLAANTPSLGSAVWSVVSGDGNEVFGNINSPVSAFSGTPGQTYVLRWTITAPCGTTQDDVQITVELACPPTFTDARDSKVYTTVLLGSQCWMGQNLAYLPSVVGPATKSTSSPYQYVWGYNGTNVTSAKATSEFNTCGVLYNYAAAQSACPSGWHLPTDQEWKDLEMFLGMTLSDANNTGWRGTNQGTQLKAQAGDTPSFNGTNSSGFKAGACGWYDTSGFGNWGGAADFWSTATGDGWRRLAGGITGVGRFSLTLDYGLSVRCVKN